MSKFIKINQAKPDSETRTELYTDLEKSIEEKEKAIEQQKDQLETMQELDMAKSDNIYKISQEILNKTNQKLAFNTGTIEVAKHFPPKEFKSKFVKMSGVMEDYQTGLDYLYNENAESCDSCGDLKNNEGICENPECDNFNISGNDNGYILDKRNKYPQRDFDIDTFDPYSEE